MAYVRGSPKDGRLGEDVSGSCRREKRRFVLNMSFLGCTVHFSLLLRYIHIYIEWYIDIYIYI